MILQIAQIASAAKCLWNMIPPNLRDWSKSEVLNFVQNKIPSIFRFCKDKINYFWSKVPNSQAKTIVDKTTSTFLALNERIPQDIKRRLFEQITGAKYNPDPGFNTQALSETIHTDDEKKAAAIQMVYLMAFLGEINQKQESMLQAYMNSLMITEELKLELINEMQEAEKELAKFAQELDRLDKEFERTSIETEKIKREANDIIDHI